MIIAIPIILMGTTTREMARIIQRENMMITAMVIATKFAAGQGCRAIQDQLGLHHIMCGLMAIGFGIVEIITIGWLLGLA